MRTQLPDILERFPPGTLAIWRKTQVYPRRTHTEYHHDYVMARVVGKCPRQGNKRLALYVLYCQRNPFGEMVMYVKRMSSVSVENVIAVADWYRMRGQVVSDDITDK